MQVLSMMDEEANQAAYCLLALSRSTPKWAKINDDDCDDERTTLIDGHFATSPPVTLPTACPGAESIIEASVIDDDNDVRHPSQFMIARILTDLTRVPQELLLNVKEQTTTTTTTVVETESVAAHRGVLNSSRPTPAARISTQQPPGAKAHRCPFAACERTYAKSSHLATHMRTHTGTCTHTPHHRNGLSIPGR